MANDKDSTELSTGAKIVIGGAIVALIGGITYFIWQSTNVSGTGGGGTGGTTNSGYTLTLTGPATADEGVPANYTANLTNGSTPVSGVNVTLNGTGPSNISQVSTTDSNGNATFSVTFPDTGTYQLQASAEVS